MKTLLAIVLLSTVSPAFASDCANGACRVKARAVVRRVVHAPRKVVHAVKRHVFHPCFIEVRCYGHYRKTYTLRARIGKSCH